MTALKILHTSDWHVGRTMRGRSRIDEHRVVLAEMGEVARREAVDVVLMSGDVFDVAAPSPEAERVVYRAFLDLAEVAPVVLVAGNHDNPRRLQAVAPLLELGRVRVGAKIMRPAEGGVIDDLGIPLRVAMLPWQSQRGIVSATDLLIKDAVDQVQDYEARMRRLIEALTSDMTTDTVNVVAAHAMVHGAAQSGSERHAHIFGYAIPALSFPGSLSYVALGHLHRQQQVPSPAPVWYSGSPLQLDFGEAGDQKGVLIVEAEPGLPVRVRPVPLMSGTPLIRLTGTLAQVKDAAEGLPEHAYVKVELEEPGRTGLADEVRELVPGAVDVVLATPPTQRLDRAAVRRIGREPRELFLEYLANRSVEDPDLLALFDELLEEIHEA